MEAGAHIHIGRDRTGRLFIARCLRCGQFLGSKPKLPALLEAAREHMCASKTRLQRSLSNARRSAEQLRSEARELRQKSEEFRRKVQQQREELRQETREWKERAAGLRPKRGKSG